MQDTGCLGLVHWDDPEGWYGRGGGRGVQEWELNVHPWWIHVDVWQNQYSIVKLKKNTGKKISLSPTPVLLFKQFETIKHYAKTGFY